MKAKFKVGDRVFCARKNSAYVDMIGTVTLVRDDPSSSRYQTKLDNPPFGYGPSSALWNFDEDDLRRLTPLEQLL